jgi:predicted Fe-Mo cluster-binding NifX family protein
LGTPFVLLVQISILVADTRRKILHNPHLKEEKGKGIKVSEWLVRNGVDTVYTRKGFEGKGPSYVFSNAEVDVIVTEVKTIEEIKQDLTYMESNSSNEGRHGDNSGSSK